MGEVKKMSLEERLAWMETEGMDNSHFKLAIARENGDDIEFMWADVCDPSAPPLWDRQLPHLDVVLCDPADANLCNSGQLKGKMAVARMGVNSITAKAQRIAAAGAQGLIIVNTSDGLCEVGVTDVSCAAEIPVVIIRAKDVNALLSIGNSSCLVDITMRVQNIMWDMDSVGIPRQVADLPPAGWKPFARQKPFSSFAPDEEGVVYVCGVYGSTNWVDGDEMASMFDAFSQEADNLVKRGHVEEGLRKLEVVLKHFKSTGNEDGQIRTLQQKGIIQLRDSKAKAAIVSFNAAASLLDEVQSRLIPVHHSEPAGSRSEIPAVDRKLDVCRRATFEHHAPLYGWLIAALIEQGNIEEAFLVSEKSKAQSMSQLRRGESTNESWEAYSQTAALEQAVVLEYAFTPSPLQEGQQQLVVWVLSHYGALLGHDVIVYNGGKFGNPQEDVSSRLSTLLERMRSALGVTRGKVKEWVISKVERQLAIQKKILMEMYDILIRPVEKWLHSCTSDGADDLLIVPHMILNDIPWSALMDEEGKYVLEVCSVRLAPSLKTLKILRSGIKGRHEHGHRAFIVGNPSPTAGELKMDDLEWAEREARAVEDCFSTHFGASWKVDAVYGAGATRQVVKRGFASCDWIHLACHSMMEEQALILASTEDDDGVTRMGTLQEAFGSYGGVKRGSVVVLSACNTGRGPVTSEGVEGMYRSFFAAGSATILVSLWYIDDKSTFDMMKCLYDHLGQGLSLHKSLRYAMLFASGKRPMQGSPAGREVYEDVKKGSVNVSPAFWAGFTAVGCESFLSA